MTPADAASHPIRLYRFEEPVDYREGRSLQSQLAAGVRVGDGEALVLLEHTPVITLGRRSRHEHVLADAGTLSRLGVEVIETDRGGDATFHGPGQLVAYPVLDLKARHLGPAAYVRLLEQCLIDLLAGFGLAAVRVAGLPGVWVDGAKVAAIGVRVEGGVSTHGLALNVSTDLESFELIVPCGNADAGVTSLRRLLGFYPRVDRVADAFAAVFARHFNAQFVAAVKREVVSA